MSEQDTNTMDNIEVVEELPPSETPVKIKKTSNTRKIRTIKTSKIKRS